MSCMDRHGYYSSCAGAVPQSCCTFSSKHLKMGSDYRPMIEPTNGPTDGPTDAIKMCSIYES